MRPSINRKIVGPGESKVAGKPGSGLPSVPPEVDTAAVGRWRDSGGDLIDLLTRAHLLGGVSSFRIGPKPTVLVTDPQAVQHVLVRHTDRYVKHPHRARVLLGDGVVAIAPDDKWKRQRRLLHSQFTGEGILRYEQRIEDAVQRVADKWAYSARSGRPRDLAEDMEFFAMDTIWRTLTGHLLDTETHRELRALETVVTAIASVSAPQVELAPHVAAELARVDAVAERAIEAAHSEPMGPAGPGVLHVLLDAVAEYPQYTRKLVRDELVTLLLAGQETTATTLTWVFVLLAGHPELREWVLDTEQTGCPARTSVIQALINETLRLYPAAWIVPRTAAEDDVLCGFRIEAGSKVVACPYLTHRDPAIWPDSDRFIPRRFLAAERPRRTGAYYPFGIGPRTCIGMQFTMREMTMLLEHLLPAFLPTLHVAPQAVFGSITVKPEGPVVATVEACP
ncbi:cytochrome P450 [Amycolatopsis sp. NPDC049868]|uniref:cytochrome P450 n=1 Tax=Amycolatopsis sp. NPDC049868 TaxID=3363934 RepID=UPI0037A6EE05